MGQISVEVLPLAVLALVALVIIILFRTMARSWTTGRIICPYCGLRFEKSALLVSGHSIVSCPFCKRMSEVHIDGGKMTARKISETDLAKLFQGGDMDRDRNDEQS